VHACSALGSRGGKHDASHEPRSCQRDLLGYEAADRETQEVDLSELERVEEQGRVIRHLGDRAWRLPAGAADAGVVEGDDTPVLCESVDQHGVPVLEVPSEVLEKDQRDLSAAEVPVDEGGPIRCVDLLVLRR